jgi:hypothetical protein
MDIKQERIEELEQTLRSIHTWLSNTQVGIQHMATGQMMLSSEALVILRCIGIAHEALKGVGTMHVSESDTIDLVNKLLGTIAQIVTAVGGRVDRIHRTEEGLVLIELSGLSEGPLTEEQVQAARALEEIGIKCQTNSG